MTDEILWYFSYHNQAPEKHVTPLGSDGRVHMNTGVGTEAVCVVAGINERPKCTHNTQEECCVTCRDCIELRHA